MIAFVASFMTLEPGHFHAALVQKKMYPGYVLVRMRLDDNTWGIVRNTPGVTGFVSAGTGTKPTPLSKHEGDKILTVRIVEASLPRRGIKSTKK